MEQPKYIVAIYDNKGKTCDRYTVVVDFGDRHLDTDIYDCLGLSDNPTHSQGFSQWCTCQLDADMGFKIEWSNLPAHIQEHVLSRCNIDAP